MNVFVLSTGRCGSTTFRRACNHIENYTSSHESNIGRLKGRLDYPDDHIEVDNRLSWFLGRLDDLYGDDAFYVHLRRDREATARSFLRRYNSGVIAAYRRKILTLIGRRSNPLDVCKHYCDTINANISLFLKDKSNRMEFWLETAEDDFRAFWDQIGATGNFSEAVEEWSTKYNASDPSDENSRDWGISIEGGIQKARRVVRKFPDFLRNA